jgi:putative ABC transport system permease protein
MDPMLAHDVRFAFRVLRKAPASTSAAVIAIALGVGATTAIFTVVERVLLHPLPYPEPARIVDINENIKGKPFAVSAVNLQDWRARNHTVAAMAAYAGAVLTLSSGSEPERIVGQMVEAPFFDAMGVPPVFGRTFTADEVRPNGPKLVVLGYGVWQRRFGADPTAIGRTITLDGRPYQVIGVMPRFFSFPEGTEMWIPLPFTADDLNPTQRGAHYLSVVARLRPGITLQQAQDDFDAIERDLAQQFPAQVAKYSAVVQPLLDRIVADVRTPLLVLLGAVIAVLLIACVNVSNLLLARATARTGEIAVRAALGASRVRLLRQLVIESVALALLGGAAGVLLAAWGLRALLAISPDDLPRAADVTLSMPVLVTTSLVSMLTGVLFGLAPALFASKPDLATFLKDVHRDSSSSSARRRLRGALVAA